MRTDVKLGVVFSMVLVLLLGGYFVYPRGNREIPLSGELTRSDQTSGPTKGEVARGRPPVGAGSSASGEAAAPRLKSERRASAPPLQRGNLPKNRAQLADQLAARRDLPVSGASVPGDPADARDVPVPQTRPTAGGPQRGKQVRGPGPSAKPPTSAGPAGGERSAGAGEKHGTPPPPGLLAATRAKGVSEGKPAVDLHHVQAGDTFAKLAEEYYGSSKHVGLLMEANPRIPPGKLRIGMTVRIPALPLGAETAAMRTPKSEGKSVPPRTARTYTVKAGDSFYRIAERELGDGGRWKEIYALNQELVGADPSRLRIGQVLRLPQR